MNPIDHYDTASAAEQRYFTDDELVRIEAYCNEGPAGKGRDLVVSIMEFLAVKGYLTARQKGAVLGIIRGWDPSTGTMRTLKKESKIPQLSFIGNPCLDIGC